MTLRSLWLARATKVGCFHACFASEPAVYGRGWVFKIVHPNLPLPVPSTDTRKPNVNIPILPELLSFWGSDTKVLVCDTRIFIACNAHKSQVFPRSFCCFWQIQEPHTFLSNIFLLISNVHHFPHQKCSSEFASSNYRVQMGGSQM